MSGFGNNALWIETIGQEMSLARKLNINFHVISQDCIVISMLNIIIDHETLSHNICTRRELASTLYWLTEICTVVVNL